jgi:hypothetical protein
MIGVHFRTLSTSLQGVQVVTIYVDETTPSSDGFCVVNKIHRGGAVDISDYDQMNDEILRVQVGDSLLRVKDISCKYVPR